MRPNRIIMGVVAALGCIAIAATAMAQSQRPISEEIAERGLMASVEPLRTSPSALPKPTKAELDVIELLLLRIGDAIRQQNAPAEAPGP